MKTTKNKFSTADADDNGVIAKAETDTVTATVGTDYMLSGLYYSYWVFSDPTPADISFLQREWFLNRMDVAPEEVFANMSEHWLEKMHKWTQASVAPQSFLDTPGIFTSWSEVRNIFSFTPKKQKPSEIEIKGFEKEYDRVLNIMPVRMDKLKENFMLRIGNNFVKSVDEKPSYFERIRS